MFIIHSLHRVGGAETVLTHLSNYFASNLKHNITLCILSNDNIRFNIDPNINIIKNKNKKHSLLNIFQQINYLKKNIHKVNPDILISFVTGINILSIITAKLTSKPIIISERSSYDFGVKNKTWRLLRRIVYPHANVLVLPTKEESHRYDYTKEISVIKNPLLSKKNFTQKKRKNVILGVGSLSEVKGFDMLITAFHNLKLHDWKLIILGEGIQRPQLEKQIEQLKLHNSVFLLGHTQDTESYYKKSSIFILSSRSEGYPNVLCEAMSYGCPAIAFNCPTGPKDIIENNKNGILVEAENIKELSKSIGNLIKDNNLRNELSKEAKKISITLNIHQISKQWEVLLETTIKNFNTKISE